MGKRGKREALPNVKPVGWLNLFNARVVLCTGGDRDPRRREKEGDCTGW